MKNENELNRYETLSIEERREVRKQWGKEYKRHFYCVNHKDFQTPYYIEAPQQIAQLAMKYIIFYITDFYGMEKEDIHRINKVPMKGCMTNWHKNIFVDISYVNLIDSNGAFVMTLGEQRRVKYSSKQFSSKQLEVA